MVIAYIGLGSNLGDREEHLRRALDHLRSVGAVEVLEVSPLAETDPMGGPSQPRYLNAVARVRTELAPADFLAVLKEAEVVSGRKPRGVRWGPREADLDLVLYGDHVIETEELTVPHPRFRERGFVLDPLFLLAPDMRDPVTGRTIRELRDDLERSGSGRRIARLMRTIPELREYVAMADRNRFTIGLVPTMGAFHEGHLSLMRAARDSCDKVIVSLFVNPAQFGEGEDLDRYPQRLDADLELASEVGVDVVFRPTEEDMYPAGFRTKVRVEGLSEILCGASRPTHFSGVTTVVAKLFNLVRPQVAFFGLKDFQQGVVIRRMVKDLDLDVEVRLLPTVREEDGLALSSRNRYLDEADRAQATALHRGQRNAETLVAKIRDALEAESSLEPEYVAVVDPETLEPVREIGQPVAILVAARVGETRLIDNLLLPEEA